MISKLVSMISNIPLIQPPTYQYLGPPKVDTVGYFLGEYMGIGADRFFEVITKKGKSRVIATFEYRLYPTVCYVHAMYTFNPANDIKVYVTADSKGPNYSSIEQACLNVVNMLHTGSKEYITSTTQMYSPAEGYECIPYRFG